MILKDLSKLSPKDYKTQKIIYLRREEITGQKENLKNTFHDQY